MDFIVKNVLKVKMTSFRKWPQMQEGGVKIVATNFALWDSEVESVLPRQSYYFFRTLRLNKGQGGPEVLNF